nr:unnamed protein product [Digitaria exilis]
MSPSGGATPAPAGRCLVWDLEHLEDVVHGDQVAALCLVLCLPAARLRRCGGGGLALGFGEGENEWSRGARTARGTSAGRGG